MILGNSNSPILPGVEKVFTLEHFSPYKITQEYGFVSEGITYSSHTHYHQAKILALQLEQSSLKNSIEAYNETKHLGIFTKDLDAEPRLQEITKELLEYAKKYPEEFV